MKGSPEVITALQAGLVAEAHLNIQCRNYQHQIKYMGIDKVAKQVKAIGSDAHCFQKEITKRLLFLEGSIGFVMPAIIDGEASLTDILKNILALELAIVGPYEQAVQIAMAALDDTTRNLFEHLLKWHEDDDNICWLQQQLALIGSLGEAEYLAEQL